MKAFILAGGKGTRLRPYTFAVPKPLVPVADRPVLEIVIEQLKSHGFDDIFLCTGYMADMIKAYFGDGSKHGVKITYLQEPEPLGTAGPLALADGINEPFLVMMGDVITTLNLGDFMKQHVSSGAVMTTAAKKRKHNIEFGVMDIDSEGNIKGFREKPEMEHLVNMGVYAISPEALKKIPKGKRMDLPDLVLGLIRDGKKVKAHVTEEYWRDIGRHDDYDKVQQEFAQIKDKLKGNA